MGRPLVVVAVRQEARHLDAHDVVLTGIGKVSAAVAVTAAIAARRPSLVLNVGTAGALRDHMTGTHVIGRVIEHDVDHAFLGRLIGEDLSGEVVLDPDIDVTLATGDAFVADGALRDALAARAHLVDMEGYAVARACEAAGVPCRIVKVVSDTASDGAAATWVDEVDRTARAIADAVAEHL
ncbi:nucleosidase [Actinomarinicola tropica]|uniref:Nucleoside phosphorylase n=1 Tax=Actinomarinicola tropica TaxID=2789776 RepID=A0A5Q2RIE4_9ACTN|nr:nucleosidase [Actinomarinicola tropica]QGG96559.1 nucleoside phosphorylase [Actinomarinicola tropica]